MTTFQAAVKLHPALELDPECLGATFEVWIGRVSYRVDFPYSPTPINEPPRRAWYQPPAQTPEVLRGTNDWSEEWARPQTTSGATNDVLSVRVGRVLLSGEFVGADRALVIHGMDLGFYFDRWYSIAFAWMNLWSRQYFSVEQWRPTTPRSSATLVTSEGENATWGGAIRVGSMEPGPRGSLSMLQAAFVLADRGIRPSVARLLLISARGNDDPRQQVIDAATAAEVTVESKLRLLLTGAGHSDVQIAALTKPLQGIAEKLRLLEVFTQPERSLVNKVAHRIAEPRNRAAHAGYVPSADDLKFCLEVATEVIDSYDPLLGHTSVQL